VEVTRLLPVLCLALTVAHAEPLEMLVGSNEFRHLRTRAVTNLVACESLSFRVRGKPGAFEVQFLEADGRAKFWRRVDLASTNETAVTIPLRFMRRDGLRSPRWDNIRHFGLFFRNSGTFCFDDFMFRRNTGTKPELGADELAAIAFPGATVRSVKKPEMTLLTDSTELELPKLEAELHRFIEQARRDMSFLSRPSAPAVLLVFAKKSDYEQFAPRFAKLLNSTATPSVNDGYTVEAISTSYWDPAQGTLRPVYLHEFTHSWFERVAVLPGNGGGWLQEGLAGHYQLLFHPQENFGELVRKGIEDPEYRWPLRELCSGERLPVSRYWQAATLMRMMLTAPKYREQLRSFLAGSQPTDWDGLAYDWIAFCRETYGADK